MTEPARAGVRATAELRTAAAPAERSSGSGGGSPAAPSTERAPASTDGAPTALATRFLRRLRRRPDLLPRGSRVLIAYSGGSDSTALLHLLSDVAGDLDLELRAAHFDHGLREKSAREAERAAEACRRLGVACRVDRAGPLSGGQAAYREARYGFLSAEADAWGADRVALAHQRDDQIETALLHLLRGTGLKGLAGMPARRGRYVRPLLGFGREELRADLAARGVAWLDDPSNRDPRYARSRVRHALLPALERAAGGGLERLLLETAAAARRADRGLDRRASALLARATLALDPGGGAQIARPRLRAYDRADRARILRLIARRQGIRLGRGGTAIGVQFMTGGSSGRGVDIASGLRVSREFDTIRVGPPPDEPPPDREVEIPGPGSGRAEAELGGRRYEVAWGGAAGSGEGAVTLARDGLRFPLMLRGPRPGDRIRTRVGSRKLKKLWNEWRVPRSERPSVPVLVAADGRVLWVAGETAEPDRPTGEGETFRIHVRED